jgi:hypothetical protein
MLATGFGQVATPPVPTNLTATPTPDATPAVRLAWGVPSGTWGFLLYRSVDDSTHFQKLAMVNATVYVDHTVRTGHVYYYYVTSIGMSNSATPVQSGPSNIAMIRIGGTIDRPVGAIAGKVTDDSTGAPIPGARILFTPLRPTIQATIALPYAVTDNLGAYAVKLDTGAYKLRVEPAPWMPPSPPPYLGEWYDNKKDFAAADPVRVFANASTEANFGLSRVLIPTVPKGTITGKVTDETTGDPIAGMLVRSFRRGNSITKVMPVAVTDSLGLYSMKVDTGTYFLRTESLRMSVIDYIMEWYDNVTDVTKATPVTIGDGATFEANFQLAKPVPPTFATVEGTVTDTLGNPLRRATVVIMRTLQDLTTASSLPLVPALNDSESMDVEGVGYCRGVIWKGLTDSLGHYKAQLIANRAYIAMAAKWGYLHEYYNNQPTPLLADIIKVTGDMTGIDFSLTPNPVIQNSISGVVRDSAGSGVPSIIVLFPAHRLLPVMPLHRVGYTDSTGAYTIGNVRAGRYFVLALPFGKYAPAFYKAGAYGVMHMAKADTVIVSGDVSGIDIGVVQVNSTGLVRVRGRIFAAGKPLPGARILATNGGIVVGNGLTDSEGTYAIDGVPSGIMALTVDAAGYTGADKSVDVPESSFAMDNVDFTMQTETPTDVSASGTMPSAYALHQNYPNPFNPSTTISFDMPSAGQAKLSVFNMLGQEVATLVNGSMASGRASIVWNATDRSGLSVASGVYFYQLTVHATDGRSTYRSVQKMLLVR